MYASTTDCSYQVIRGLFPRVSNHVKAPSQHKRLRNAPNFLIQFLHFPYNLHGTSCEQLPSNPTNQCCRFSICVCAVFLLLCKRIFFFYLTVQINRCLTWTVWKERNKRIFDDAPAKKPKCFGGQHLEGRRALGPSWSSVNGGLGMALLHKSGRRVFAVAFPALSPTPTPIVVYLPYRSSSIVRTRVRAPGRLAL
jgi:hypothetical protein